MTADLHLTAADTPEHVLVPAVRYVAVDGTGSPGTDDFYRKKRLIGDLAQHLGGDQVPVIEIMYWYPDGSAPVEIADFYSVNPIPSLQYRVLARVPDAATTKELAAARLATAEDVASDDIELVNVPEHDVVQVMHHGPFAEEFGTLARLGTFAREQGLRRGGPHHEIHLDGFTRTTPQNTLRTILRDPVA